MSARSSIPILLAWLLATADVASAQSTDLRACLSNGEWPQCDEVAGGLVISPTCTRYFRRYYGRIAWFPLRCAGPITIEVEDIAIFDTIFPVYVEVVPLRQPAAPCANDPGFVVFIVRGNPADCGGWETSSPIDITHLVPIGSLYAIRLHFFGSLLGRSPAMDCIRVTATPGRSDVEAGSWGRFKQMYK